MHVFTTCLVLALATASASQSTIVVTGGGAALQQAIEAAAPGDTLDVHAAIYDAVTVDKGLRVLCRPGVVITPSNDAAVTIRGVPAAQHCEWTGGTCRSAGLLVPAVRIADCSGTVVLRGAIQAGGTNSLALALRADRCTGPLLFDGAVLGIDNQNSACVLQDCAAVSFNGCVVRDTLFANQSTVSITDSVLEWSLSIASGTVAIADTDVQGELQSSAVGSPGIALISGELALAGTMEVVARTTSQAPAILTAAGVVRIGPGVTLRAVNSPPITGPATVLRQHLPSVHAPSVASGQILEVRVAGMPGALTGTFLDLTPTPMPTPFGPLWVTATSPVVDTRTLGPSGEFRISIPATVPAGTAATLQPLSWTPTTGLLVGTPVRVHIH